ncbi:class I SAM-dependent methyltransferase [Tropicimonas marinistellae]|uniref:class I SAM-dependent methyltransferase n=1 Tax=Tropicimonas marinistellae TaxID=1739787 RepID=UPI00082B91A8|nr:class I SAM-dependent methyltransferase [Tropicimonas marinistellae]
MTTTSGSAAAIALYEDRADMLAARYDAVPNERFYAPVRHLIPMRPSRVADIGTATGRDARWFADMGHSVVAVDPVAGFLDRARRSDTRIDWVRDALPDLPRLVERGETFDFINLSGVWQHLDPEECARAAPVLRRIAAPSALLNLALRIGPSPQGLPVFPIDPNATAGLFTQAGFEEVLRAEVESTQEANRAAGVRWTWLVLRAKEGCK